MGTGLKNKIKRNKRATDTKVSWLVLKRTRWSRNTYEFGCAGYLDNQIFSSLLDPVMACFGGATDTKVS